MQPSLSRLFRLFTWFCEDCLDPQNKKGNGERRILYKLSAEIASWDNAEAVAFLASSGLSETALIVVEGTGIMGSDFDGMTFEVLVNDIGLEAEDAEVVLTAIANLSAFC